jgi:hypothetical protein
MSLALYRYRLFWNGRHGAMRSGAQTQVLNAAPTLPGAESLKVDEIDYAPEVDVAQLRETGGDWRQMNAVEVEGAQRLLAMLAANESFAFAAA